MRPSVRTLYESAIRSGITLRLSKTSVPTLVVDYTKLVSDEPLSRQELNDLEDDFRTDIEEHQSEITEFLKQREIITAFRNLLSSKSIDNLNRDLLAEIRERIIGR